MVDKINYLLPVVVGAAGLSLYAYFEYKTWLKQKKPEMTKDDKVSHKLMLNKVYASVVIGQVDLIASNSGTDVEVDKRCKFFAVSFKCSFWFLLLYFLSISVSEDDVIFSLIIKGNIENVREAESYINRIIEAAPEMTSAVLEIPKDKVKVIVSNFGSKILSLSQETGCKFYLKCDLEFYDVSPFYVEIQGPTTQTLFAYNLVKNMLMKEPVASPTSELEHIPKEFPLDIINETKETNYVGVIVSYISTISNFWVQLHRLNSTLDKMERRLFEHFSSIEVLPRKVLEPKVGLFIAVPYTQQSKWHRARIISCNKEIQATDLYAVKALFVDYGDIEDINLQEVRLLPEEFLQYPYFAVECCLGGISPTTVNSKGEEEWSEEALDVFEALVIKSQKILMACKVGEIHIQGDDYSEAAKRTIPSITLVDTNSAEDKVIAQELVDQGYARWTNKEPEDTLKGFVDDDSDLDFDSFDE